MPDSVTELVARLAVRGVQLFMDGDRLRCRGPRDALTPDVLSQLHEHGTDLVAFLRGDSRALDGDPLTRGQQSLYLHQRLAPESAAYNLAVAIRLTGPGDRDGLDEALRAVLARHPVLRTTYEWEGAAPTQTTQAVPVSALLEEWTSGPEVDGVVEEFMDRPFDLEQELPLRALLVHPDDGSAILVLVVHHIAADLWSMEVVVEEWLAASQGADLAPAGPGFAERIAYERACLADGGTERHHDFWRAEIGSASTALDLPFDAPRPAAQTFRGDCVTTSVGPELSARLSGVARDASVTPNMLFVTAFQVLLHKLSGLEDILVGMPAANRWTPREERSVGFFADPTIVHGQFGDDPVFRELLTRTRTALLAAADHPVPFPLLAERLARRDAQRSPLFQVMYVWERTIGSQERIEVLPSSRQRGAAYDLILGVRHHDDGTFGCSWTYNQDLFTRETVERFDRAFAEVLETVAGRPDLRVSMLPAMAEVDGRALRRSTTGPVVPLGGRGWLEEFENQGRRVPDAVALVCGAASVTYRQLAERSGRMAAVLRARGVGEDVRVGLCLERSPDLVVAMLAVMLAGGAYVPLDPGYPAGRLAYMLGDAEVSLCIVDERGRAAVGDEAPRTALVSMADLTIEATTTDPAPIQAVPEDALAYVIYTSGSTGRPKGVMVTRRNVANLFVGLDRAVDLDTGQSGDQPVWLAVTSVCFDISVLELLWTVCRGLKVVIDVDRWAVPAATGSGPARPVDLSLFYFAAETGRQTGHDLYRLLIEGARFADENGLHAVWLPERHFHAFGGAYPNPSVLAAAVAAVTERVRIRAGSVVLPLHDPLRVAEEWSVVDNLSAGRVGLSFASGWQPDDFVLAPGKFTGRRESMWTDLDVVRRLWRGESIRRGNGAGQDTDVRTLPRPVQPELPVWATAAGSEDTFRRAGAEGVNLLTHLLGQNVRELGRKIAAYREARRAAGHDEGRVTLMLHTFVHPDPEFVRATVHEPFKNYLRSSLDLMRGMAAASGLDPERDREAVVEQAFERYFATSALFGTPESCADLVRQVSAAGVDEIGCLLDFGVDDDLVLDGLKHLGDLARTERETASPPTRSLTRSVVEQGITHLQCTPTLVQLLLLEESEGALAEHSLRRLLVGGEAPPPGLGARLRSAGIPEVLNMYGPTETCVWSAVGPLDTDDGRPATIGGPIANTSLHVLDRRLRPVPIGVPGDLYIGGEGVSRGYWRRPALTAERFLPDPFAGKAGTRMYATGDIVRHLGEGRLEFLGRADHQVKVRGHRVEFGEIESVLAAHPDVAGCAVTTRADSAGGVSLVAFLVMNAGAHHDEAGIRAHARGLLPEHMLPSRTVVLPGLPQTLNGKLDRGELGRLAQQAGDSGAAAVVAPRNAIEESLQRIWQDLLGHRGVGVHDNFFEIGGHSLLAATMRAQISALGVGSVDLVDVFTYPTIGELAARLSRGAGAEVTLATGAAVRARQQRDAARRQQVRRRIS